MITPALNNLEFSKNFPVLRCTGYTQPVSVQLTVAGVQVLDEQYMLDAAGGFDLRISNLLHSFLTSILPSSSITIQNKSLIYTELKINQDVFNFNVIKGGVNSAIIQLTQNYALNFCIYNFLTWQPRIKSVQNMENQYLTYYCTQNSLLKCEILPSEDVFTLFESSNDQLVTFDLSSLIPVPLDAVTQINIWAQFDSGNHFSFTQSFLFRQLLSENEDKFVFENSLGGWDTAIFTGDLSEVDSHDVKTAQINEELLEYDIDFSRTFKKDSGYIASEGERLWLREFFTSINRYHVTPDGLKRILVKSFENETRKGELNSFSFTFSYAKDNGTISIPR